MEIEQCREIDAPTYEDDRGILTVWEEGEGVPFDIERAFYIYGVPDGTERGGHAHRRTEQVLVALSGAVDLRLDDGEDKKTYRCDAPQTGVYIPEGIWTDMTGFSEDAVVLVLASTTFDEDEYIRDYEEFLEWRGAT